jgi:hypothetical protein
MLSRSITWGQLKAIHQAAKDSNMSTLDDLIERYNLEEIAKTKPDNELFYPKKESN